MRVIRARDFTGDHAWASIPIELFGKASVKLHWTDQPYIWHVNDGPEVFAVLDGEVDMHVREGGTEQVLRLSPGDIFHAETGDAHVAHPVGAARVLVIEQPGSV